MGPRRLARLLGVALAITAAVPAVGSAAIETWPASAADKVFPDSTRPAAVAAGVEIAAGRDEYEGAQIAIRTDAATTIRPSASPLTGPGVIPASAVDLFRVGYVTLRQPSTGVDALRGDGRYPDPLIPVDAAFDVPAGETTSLYVRVHVPGDAPAGVYQGTVDLGAAGQVPLRLEVAPVTANRGEYRMVARLSVLSLARELGVSYEDPAFLKGVYSDLLPMLEGYGVSPGRPPAAWADVNPTTWAMSWSGQSAARLDGFLGMRFPAVEVPFLPNLPAEDRGYTQDAKRRAAAQSIATRFGGAVSRSFALPVDEPNPTDYPTVVRAAEQLRAAQPAIPVMVTEAPTKAAVRSLGRHVDIWTPPLWDHYKDPQASARLLGSGKQVWWYVYGSDTQRFTPNVLIDKPGTEPRLLGWLAERDGLQGFFYWGLNNWEDGRNGPQSPGANPWYLSHTKIDVKCGGGASRAVGGNGEASLIWPGSSPARPAYGSLRLEALRDGAEDYALLKRLREVDPTYHQRVLDGLVTPYTGASDGQDACLDESRPGYLPVVENDPAAVSAARRAVLDRLSGKPQPTLSGRVVFATATAPLRKRSSLQLGGKGVPGAVVRFAGFEAVTDRNGYWTLPDIPNSPGTLRVSRDPAGRVDPVEVAVTAENIAAGTVEVPPLPAPDGRPMLGKGLSRFAATRRPATVRLRGGAITARLSNAYRANGDSIFAAGGTTPSVEAGYARVAATRAARNWSGFRYLDMNVEVLQDTKPGERWYLIVTPGGHYKNARNLALGRRFQHVRVDLRKAHPEKGPMRRMNDVRYIRFGVQSALPKKWRGGHTPTVTLRISDLQLVR